MAFQKRDSLGSKTVCFPILQDSFTLYKLDVFLLLLIWILFIIFGSIKIIPVSSYTLLLLDRSILIPAKNTLININIENKITVGLFFIFKYFTLNSFSFCVSS